MQSLIDRIRALSRVDVGTRGGFGGIPSRPRPPSYGRFVPRIRERGDISPQGASQTSRLDKLQREKTQWTRTIPKSDSRTFWEQVKRQNYDNRRRITNPAYIKHHHTLRRTQDEPNVPFIPPFVPPFPRGDPEGNIPKPDDPPFKQPRSPRGGGQWDDDRPGQEQPCFHWIKRRGRWVKIPCTGAYRRYYKRR